MTLLDDFLLSGRAADFILALVVLEAVLLGLRARRGGAPATARWLSPLAAGAALVLALRLALVDAAPALIGAALLAAGVAHLAGYAARWLP
jgi:hypothetical protein